MFKLSNLIIPLSILFFLTVAFLAVFNLLPQMEKLVSKIKPLQTGGISEEQKVAKTEEDQVEVSGVQKINREVFEPYIKLGNCKIEVETAKTDQERQRGLSGRNNLAENSGMLFILPQRKIQPFWMLNMKFPLDFVWVRENKVVTVHQNVPAPAEAESGRLITVKPDQPVDYVLEINAGKADSCEIEVGDNVEIVLEK